MKSSERDQDPVWKQKIISKKIEKITGLKKTISQDSMIKLIDKNKTYINFKE